MYDQVELYMKPEEILDKMKEGYCEMLPSEQGFLCGLLKKYCPHKIVEVGVAGGGTTAVIMKCLDMIHSDAKMYSVDLNEQCYRRKNKMTGYQLEEVKEELQNYSNHKFPLGHILPEVINTIGDGIDFVVLDTVHSLPGEMLDFLCILPYLKDGAVVVMHDTVSNFYRSRNAYATKIVLDAAAGKKYFNYIDEILNIAAVEINEDTKRYAANLFSAFSITWNYIPAASDINCYREIYQRHYDKECNDLFDIFYKKQIGLSGKKSYYFVEKQNLTNVYDLKDMEVDADKMYHHFMENNDEVIYFLGINGKLYGIVSRGDLYRYYENHDKNLKVNQKYSAVCSSEDLDGAEKIFSMIKTIHEVPVVDHGNLKGVIRNTEKNCKREWEIYKWHLRRIKIINNYGE